MEGASLLLLAFAVSIDSFGVGLTYGLRKMEIPFLSLIFIATCSAISIVISMLLGNMIQVWLTPQLAGSFGGVILICIGLWALFQMYMPVKTEHPSAKNTIIDIEIKRLGIVIKVLRKPLTADLDHSGVITGKEAFLLGLALSLDAFGAGIGAALIGYPPLFMAISVGFMCSIFVSLGMRSGKVFSEIKWVKSISFLPGILLILLGMWQSY